MLGKSVGLWLALLLVNAKAGFLVAQSTAKSNTADQALTTPFDYSKSRNAILLHVRVNDKPAILILDTGSAHTIIRPEFLRIALSELQPTRLPPSGGGLVGDAIGREVTLQVGSWKWTKKAVAVMDISQALSFYAEKPDGLLGLDFLQEFSRVVIDLRAKTISFLK